MEEHDSLFLKLDSAICASRLNLVSAMMATDKSERILKIKTVFEQLRLGAYLLGTGPSTVGIIPITVDEVVIGRSATILEEPMDVVVDYQAADTMYFRAGQNRVVQGIFRFFVESSIGVIF